VVTTGIEPVLSPRTSILAVIGGQAKLGSPASGQEQDNAQAMQSLVIFEDICLNFEEHGSMHDLF
jgi:hypothetical protein